MKQKRIVDALGQVDDNFIDEILNDISSATKRKVSSKKFRLPFLIAAIIFLLAVTALAAENTGIMEKWAQVFWGNHEESSSKITDHQQEILEKGLVELHQSVTSNGWTITLESGISDNQRALLYYRADGPEGAIQDGGWYAAKGDVQLKTPDEKPGKGGTGGFSFTRLVDPDASDDTVYFMQEIYRTAPENAEFSIANGAIQSITITEILRFDEDSESVNTVAKGKWKFKCHFPDEFTVLRETELIEKPQKCSATQVIEGQRTPVTVDLISLKLRTLTATCTFEYPSDAYKYMFEVEPIYLVMKDGSKIHMKKSAELARDSCLECNYIFDQPVSIEDLDHVEYP